MAPGCVCDCDDVLSLILRKLPPKPLVRFRRVSRQWLALITSTADPRQYMGHGFVLQSVDGETTKLLSFETGTVRDLTLHHLPADAKIVASTNGLLFCVCGDVMTAMIAEDCYVYNLFTGEHTVVPRPSRCCKSINPSPLRIGLAVDSGAGSTFTVVSAFEVEVAHEERRFGFEIYSSSSGSWRVCERTSDWRHVYSPPRIQVCQTGATFCHGLLYWPFTSGYALTFDPLAEAPGWRTSRGWFGEYRGRPISISVTRLVHADVHGELEIIEKIEANSRLWRKWTEVEEAHINLKSELAKNQELARLLNACDHRGMRSSTYVFHPVGIVRRGSDDVVLFVTPCGRTLAFHLQSRKLELVADALLGGVGVATTTPYSTEPVYFPYYSPTAPARPSRSSWSIYLFCGWILFIACLLASIYKIYI